MASLENDTGVTESPQTAPAPEDSPSPAPDTSSAPENSSAPESSPAPVSGRPGMHAVTCSQCNKQTEVPFKPDSSRPVFCDECFKSQRARAGPGGPGGGRGGPRGGAGGRGGARGGRGAPAPMPKSYSRRDYPGYTGPFK